MAFYPYARLLWSQTANLSGAGSTSSGQISLQDVTDVWLAAFAPSAATGTTPTLTVQLDVFDYAGNLFPAVLTLTEITTAPAHQAASAGLHIASTGSMVLPELCQVTWTLGGTTPAYPGVTLSLVGR